MPEIPAVLFKTVPDITIDYAVMKKSDKVAVVPGDFGWSDIARSNDKLNSANHSFKHKYNNKESCL